MNELVYAPKGGAYVGALLHLDGRQMYTDDWAELYREFERQTRTSHAQSATLYATQLRSGVYWAEYLANARGARFVLYALPDISPTAVASCRAWLRRNRDVADVSEVRLSKLIPFEWAPQVKEITNE